jgi:hypothetical protein
MISMLVFYISSLCHARSKCCKLKINVPMMEELHTDSIDGGHEGQLWARSRVRERAYSNIPTRTLTGSGLGLC